MNEVYWSFKLTSQAARVAANYFYTAIVTENQVDLFITDRRVRVNV